MTNLVVVSLEAWDDVWRRNQHLIAGLLRSGHVNRVLFVEPAADPIHAARRRERPALGSGLRPINDLPGVGPQRLWAYHPTKWLPRKFNPRSDARWAATVRRAVSDLGMVDPVLWVNDPLGAELLTRTDWAALYDITDDWLMADRPAVELERLRRQERDLFNACREVVVCSEALLRTKSAQREVVLIPNAVDLDAYRKPHQRPDDLPDGLVALYLGTAHRDRIDIDLCLDIADRLAVNWDAKKPAHLVLVGPSPLPSEDLNALKSASTLLLGPRPSEAVPAYLQHADVLLVPHVLTDFTASLDPIKAYEYRAAVRPVVATKVPGFVNSKDPLVHAVERSAFADAVTQALLDPPPPRALPDDIPSWQDRVAQMSSVLARVQGSRA